MKRAHIEAREDVYGVLRISFRTEEDRMMAKDCLGKHQYEFKNFMADVKPEQFVAKKKTSA